MADFHSGSAPALCAGNAHARFARSLALAALALIAAPVLLACLNTANNPCGDGYCPAGFVCVEGALCARPNAGCGNGIIDSGEACDDGNNQPGDGCSADCQSDETCGNGYLDSPAEVCDCGTGDSPSNAPQCSGQGNSDLGGLCRTDCALHCGDGALAATEVCDGQLQTVQDYCVDVGFDIGSARCSNSCDGVSTSGCHEFNSWDTIGDPDGHVMWAISDRDIHIVGNGGAVEHFDGEQWRSLESPTSNDLRAIWGSDASDIHAVGADGTAIHFDGSSWSLVPVPTDEHLSDIWGTSPDCIYAVGENATLLHYDGARWTAMPSPLSGRLTAVWASSPERVFVANQTAIAHFNGALWSVTTQPSWDYITSIWGSGPDHVYALIYGQLHYLETDQWVPVPGAPGDFLSQIWGTDKDSLFLAAIYDTIYYFDGTGFTNVSPPNDFNSGYPTLARGPSERVFAHGLLGAFAFGDYVRTATDMSSLGPSGGEHLNDIWASDDQNIFAVGAAGTVLYHNGRRWEQMNAPVSADLFGVWGTGPDDVFAVGDGGAIAHYDGQEWLRMSSPTNNRLLAVWGAGSTNVYAVGLWGAFLHYDGASWAHLDPGVSADRMEDVWGSGPDDIYVAAGHLSIPPSDSILLHYDGSSWSDISDSITDPLLYGYQAVWGTGPDDVYVVGEGALHYDGATWSKLPLVDVDFSAAAVHGFASDNLVLAGPGGKLFGFEGQRWEPAHSWSSAQLQGVHTFASGEMYLVGRDATLIRIKRLAGHLFDP